MGIIKFFYSTNMKHHCIVLTGGNKHCCGQYFIKNVATRDSQEKNVFHLKFSI